LQQALNENIARYEANFGEIRTPLAHTLADDLFNNTSNPPSPEAK